MTRKKEIYEAAKEYTDDYGHFNCDLNDVFASFENGAKWADTHTPTPWHSVADGDVPLSYVDCLFQYGEGKIDKGYMLDNRCVYFCEVSPMIDIEDVRYWMEIPELPKESEVKK